MEDGSTPVAPRKRGRHVEMDPKVLKKRLKQLYNAVQSHQVRNLILILHFKLIYEMHACNSLM